MRGASLPEENDREAEGAPGVVTTIRWPCGNCHLDGLLLASDRRLSRSLMGTTR